MPAFKSTSLCDHLRPHTQQMCLCLARAQCVLKLMWILKACRHAGHTI